MSASKAGLRDAFNQTARFVIGLETTSSDGDVGIGTGFHIGDGFFLTARHVVQDRMITDVVQPAVGDARVNIIHSSRFPLDEDIDLALLSTDYDSPLGNEDGIQIGGHLDDWINDDQFILMPVLVMGYPPVPLSNRPVLIAAAGEVNGVIDRRDVPHVHFVISPVARGGFSGGPVLLDGGLLLGVITSSLERQDSQQEPAFAAAVSVDPIYTLLAQHGVAPRANRDTRYLFSLEAEKPLFDTLLTTSERELLDTPTANGSPNPRFTIPSPPIFNEKPLWTAPKEIDLPTS